MRVLHFYKSYMPEEEGGVARTINALARACQAIGVESTVLSLSNAPAGARLEIDGHAAVKAHLDFEVASTGFSASAFRLFAELAHKADIVQYHFPWPLMDVIHFATRAKPPAVLTYHSDIIRQKRMMPLYRPLMMAFLSSVDRIVATSENYVRTSPVLGNYRDKLSIIPIGIDRSFYPEPSEKRRAGWRQRVGDRFFLFTGVLRYYKGLDSLVDAAKLMNHAVVVAGDGPLALELRQRIEREGVTNVHLVGAVDEADKLALLDLATAFVFPSNMRSEAFGLALLEAAMSGRPMITCEIGTGTSYVNIDGLTGLVVPPNDPAALAAAMTKLAESSEMATTMGRQAKQRFDELFQAEAMARRHLDLYREITRSRLRTQRPGGQN